MNRKKAKLLCIFLIIVLAVLPFAGCPAARGGTVTYNVGILYFPTTNNPFAATIGQGNASHIAIMYEPLMWGVADGSVAPGLGEEWSFDEATLTWTIKINTKAKWSDGQPVTANDVKFSIEKYNELNSGQTDVIKPVLDEITVVDSKTVKFVLTQILNTFPNRITDAVIVPQHIWGDMTNDDLLAYPNNNPVISGMCMVREMEVDSHVIYDIRKDYWGGRPKIDVLVKRYYASAEAQLLALITGAIDAPAELNMPSAVPTLLTKEDIDIHTTQSNTTFSFYVNYRYEPWNLKAFRHAVHMGIDKMSMVNFAADGWGVMAGMIELAPFLAHAADGIEWPYADMTQAERIAAANAALDLVPGVSTKAAGVGGIRTYNGNLLQFELLCTTATYYMSAAEVIKQNCLDMGIDMTIVAQTATTLVGTIYRQKSAATAMNWETHIFGRPFAVEIDGLTDQYGDSTQFTKRAWIIGWENATIQNMLNQITAMSVSNPARAPLIQEVQLLMAAEEMMFPLWHPITPEAYRTDKLKGWLEFIGASSHGKVPGTIHPIQLLALEPV